MPEWSGGLQGGCRPRDDAREGRPRLTWHPYYMIREGNDELDFR